MVDKVYVDQPGRAEPVYDGIVNLKRYAAAPAKILWILRETRDEADTLAGGRLLCEDYFGITPVMQLNQSTFQPIIYITHGIFNRLFDYEQMPGVHALPNAEDLVRSIALIYAKKLPGGPRGTPAAEILKWYRKGADIIDRQIEAYGPEIIIGCSPHFPEIMSRAGIAKHLIRSHGSVAYAHFNGRLYVHVCHPGQKQIIRSKYVNDVLQLIASEFSAARRSGRPAGRVNRAKLSKKRPDFIQLERSWWPLGGYAPDRRKLALAG